MAALYIDENFPASVTAALRALGHDALTAEDDGRANQGIDDADVLQRASSLSRAVVTFDRWDFHRLHRRQPNHTGIVTCTDDPDRPAFARRIHAAVDATDVLNGQLIRVTMPATP